MQDGAESCAEPDRLGSTTLVCGRAVAPFRRWPM